MQAERRQLERAQQQQPAMPHQNIVAGPLHHRAFPGPPNRQRAYANMQQTVPSMERSSYDGMGNPSHPSLESTSRQHPPGNASYGRMENAMSRQSLQN